MNHNRGLFRWITGIGVFFSIFAAIPIYAQQESVAPKNSIAPPPVVATPDVRYKFLVLKPEAKEPFPGQEETLQELYDLFVFDLTFSDAFQVYEETPEVAYLKQKDNENNTVNFESWRNLRIDNDMPSYFLKTVLVPRGNSLFELDILVYDLVNGVRMIGKAYGGDKPFERKHMRLAGHKSTADIIRTLSKIIPITETRIAFVNYNSSNKTKEVYLVDYDGWKDSVRQITFYNSVTLFPDWSPDGTELAYVSYRDDWPDAFIHNLSQGKVTTLAKYMGANNTPRWCPDGQNLVISLSVVGNPEIYKIPSSGKKPQRLTNNQARDLSPDVSPDGSRIVYISDQSGIPQLFLMNIDGTNSHRISYDVNRKCESPFWSPVPIDGDFRIAFSGYFDNQQADIYTIKPDGTDLQMLTDGKFENLNPSWSPNGKFIIFSSSRSGKHDLYIMSSNQTMLPNGKQFQRITYLPGENLSPSWSPN